MSKIHIGKEVEELLAACRNLQETETSTPEWYAAYGDRKAVSAALAEKLDVMPMWLEDFFYSFVAYNGINNDITAEQIVQMLQIARSEVEM